MTKIVLATVPEQVNIPINICIERNIFQKYNLEIDHRIISEGTGKMIDLLEDGTLDLAFTVTDATLTACAKGNNMHINDFIQIFIRYIIYVFFLNNDKILDRNIKICGTYVSSPLVWALSGSKIHLLETINESNDALNDLTTSNISYNHQLTNLTSTSSIEQSKILHKMIQQKFLNNEKIKFGVSRLGILFINTFLLHRYVYYIS